MNRRQQLYAVFALITVFAIVQFQRELSLLETDPILSNHSPESSEDDLNEDFYEEMEELKKINDFRYDRNIPDSWKYSDKIEPLMRETFKEIYNQQTWGKFGGRSFSGAGSLPMVTTGYRNFLSSFLQENRKEIHSVLDVACGLWTFSEFINWTSVDSYTGIDIVPWIIDENTRRFGSEKFRFQLMSLTSDLPPADLLICKDVLQHLPIAVIRQFLKNILYVQHAGNANRICRYKYILFTNDMEKRFKPNEDIALGGWRRNTDLTLPPFHLTTAEIIYEFPKRSTHGKKTLLLDMLDIGCDEYHSDHRKPRGKY